MAKKFKKDEATDVASFSTKKDKLKITKLERGTAQQDAFLNYIIKSIGDDKDVSISIEGGKRIPIKDLKKKIN
tara:strand:- start:1309 stop:1527 length:219 start_codon:yes stop_codon:yes gene_type:complete